MLVHVEDVNSLVWSADRGSRLKSVRGGLSLRRISKALAQQGIRLSPAAIARWETGEAVSVPRHNLEAVLLVCGSNLSALYQVQVPQGPVSPQGPVFPR